VNHVQKAPSGSPRLHRSAFAQPVGRSAARKDCQWAANLPMDSAIGPTGNEVASRDGIPDGVTTLVCFPVAYTKGYDFSPVPRRPAVEIAYFDKWGFTRQRPSPDGRARVVDGPGVVVEIDVAAKPAEVWKVISDINMPAAFSDEFLGAEWTTDRPPGVGATFRGRNEIPGKFTWDVNCIVTEWNADKTFEWRVTDTEDPGAIWRFDLAEQGAGTRLRMSMVIGQRNNGTAPAALKAARDDPANEQKVLNGRRETLKANMQRTVQGVKSLAGGHRSATP
jgi:Polyketide cyclase / dehydrase and lipid transport